MTDNNTAIKYKVRHYSHIYLADLVEVEGKYGYFKLTSIYKEYKPSGTSYGTTGHVYFRSYSTNNYVGDIVKKELRLVEKVEVSTTPPDRKYTLFDLLWWGLVIYITIAVFIALLFS